MIAKGRISQCSLGVPSEDAAEEAVEAFQPFIEELEAAAVVEGDWPCAVVDRALLVGAISLIIQREGYEGAIKILEEELKILLQAST